MRKWIYYLGSLVRILAGFRQPFAVLRLLAWRNWSTPVTVALRDGCRFLVRSSMDIWSVKESALDRFYERGGEVRDGWTVIDVGAGIGDFTVHAARATPSGRVLAFEPLASLFAVLAHNVALYLTDIRQRRRKEAFERD
jgi:hypothetical protein